MNDTPELEQKSGEEWNVTDTPKGFGSQPGLRGKEDVVRTERIVKRGESLRTAEGSVALGLGAFMELMHL